MSRSTALIVTLSSITVVIGFTLYMRHSPSDSQMKDLSLKPSQQIIRHTAKLTSQVSVDILNSTENFKPELDENLSLRAQINLQTPATKVNYQWILPEGIEAQPGETLSGQINVQNWRDPQEIPLLLKNKSLENQKIFVRISASSPNQTDQFASAQYDTQNFLELKQEQEDLMKRQEEYLQNLPEESKKFK